MQRVRHTLDLCARTSDLSGSNGAFRLLNGMNQFLDIENKISQTIFLYLAGTRRTTRQIYGN